MSKKDSTKNVSRRNLITGALAAGIGAIAAISTRPVLAESMSTLIPQTADGVIKLVCVIRKRSDLTKEQFYNYWLNSHGPYATKLVQQLGAIRYVQSHTGSADLNVLMRASRGQYDCPYEGITEVWFRSEKELTMAMATLAGMEASTKLILDERKFIDLSRSSYFFTKEHVFING